MLWNRFCEAVSSVQMVHAEFLAAQLCQCVCLYLFFGSFLRASAGMELRVIPSEDWYRGTLEGTTHRYSPCSCAIQFSSYLSFITENLDLGAGVICVSFHDCLLRLGGFCRALFFVCLCSAL